MNDNNNGKNPLEWNNVYRVLLFVGLLIVLFWVCKSCYTELVLQEYKNLIGDLIGE